VHRLPPEWSLPIGTLIQELFFRVQSPAVALFALVHGGGHGGWSWEALVPELAGRGHAAVTPDLPFEDETAGAREWADVVVAAIDGSGASPDDVVVVGHSMGGLCVPVVATLRPVRRMVFLGALLPVPGSTHGEYLARHPAAVTFDTQWGGDTPGPSGLSWAAARHGFYADCDEQVARRAYERLRPTPLVVFTEPCPIEEWPPVPSTSIVMREDRAVGPEWSRAAAAAIGADVVELEGSHSPFYSRSAELAELLVAEWERTP
jgi:pimeloyl-ACP methyl ester carboxylesterase